MRYLSRASAQGVFGEQLMADVVEVTDEGDFYTALQETVTLMCGTALAASSGHSNADDFGTGACEGCD